MEVKFGDNTLIQYVDNEKVILLNPINMRWVRLSQPLFEKKMHNRENFMKELNDNYEMFKPVENTIHNVGAIYYSITGKCNLQCKFCALNSGPNVSTDKDLSMEEIQKLSNQIKELNIRKIVITGGEPFVRNDLNEILKCFSECIGPNKITLQTNGLLLNGDILSEIAPYINNLEISIENIFSDESLLTRMKAVFSEATKSNINLSFSFVVDKDSIIHFIKGIKLSQEFNAHFQYRIVSEIGRATENDLSLSDKETLGIYISFLDHIIQTPNCSETLIDAILGNLYPQKSCGAYGRILAIRPDGETYMCANLFDSHFSLGNVKTDRLEDITQRLKNKINQEDIKDLFLVDRNSICKNCRYLYFCNGNCVAEKIASKSNINCNLKKQLLAFSMFYLDTSLSKFENICKLRRYLYEINNEV